jgi:hypothetical protein
MNPYKINTKMKPILVMLGMFLLVLAGRDIVNSGRNTAGGNMEHSRRESTDCISPDSVLISPEITGQTADIPSSLSWQKGIIHIMNADLSGKQYVLNGIVF